MTAAAAQARGCRAIVLGGRTGASIVARLGCTAEARPAATRRVAEDERRGSGRLLLPAAYRRALPRTVEARRAAARAGPVRSAARRRVRLGNLHAGAGAPRGPRR